jgi:hypothetical protein
MRRLVDIASACSFCVSLSLAAEVVRADEPAPTDAGAIGPMRATAPRAGALPPGPLGLQKGSDGAAPSSITAESEAMTLLARAKELFRGGEYRRAVPLLERAYALTDSPRFSFNLGVLHHKLSECEPARLYFERYLLEDPAGEARAQAMSALQELNAHCPASETHARSGGLPASAAPPKSVDTHPDVSSRPLAADAEERGGGAILRGPGTAAWVLMGVGAAAGVAAVISAAKQASAQNEIDDLGSRATRDATPWDQLEAERQSSSDRAKLYRALSIGLGVACASLVGTGATLWVLEDGEGPGPGSAALELGYRGRF